MRYQSFGAIIIVCLAGMVVYNITKMSFLEQTAFSFVNETIKVGETRYGDNTINTTSLDTTETEHINIVQDYQMTDNKNQTETKMQSFVPMIIGVGRGTTGTHLMADTTCFLGYPSIHYFVGCVNFTRDDSNGGDQSSSGSSSSIPEKYRRASQLHLQLLGKMTQTSHCVAKGCKSSAVSFRDEIVQYIHDFVSYIRFNVTAKENEENEAIPLSLHDTPWPYLIPNLIQEVKHQYDGLSPVIILSERDPLTYVKRRFKTGHAVRDIMCKNHTQSSSSPESIDPGSGVESFGSLQESAFDIIECINRALDGLSHEEANKVMLDDVLTTMARIYEEQGESGLQSITADVKRYQDSMRDIADFSYDMFIQENKTKREDLAVEMLSKVKRLKRVGEPCDYVNWRKWAPSDRLTRRR